MTEKLFYQDPFLFEFTARVTGCGPEKGAFAVTLDRTAFYPEGGGQPTDLGWIGGRPVHFVKEVDGEIRHYMNEPPAVGESVICRVDAERRFDLMQQHSGEHIASGLICSTFHCENVGFHISDLFVTIDYNVPISWEELKAVEDAANRAVWADTPVRSLWPSAEELAALDYRSKKELSGDVRIVEYPGVDICACCGTHVTRTGQVGLIKFISCEPHRGGVRIEMLSGGRALAYIRRLTEQNHAVSVALSAKETETAAAVERLKKEQLAAKERLAALEEANVAARAAALAGAGDVILTEANMSTDAVRRLCDGVMNTCGGVCCVLADAGEEGVRYAFGKPDGDLRALCREMNERFGGRGGGRPYFVQGTLHGDIRAVEAALKERLRDAGQNA